MSIQDIKRKYESKLMARPNVIGCATAFKVVHGERTDVLAITCLVSKKVDISQLKAKDVIPETIDGAPTDVIEVGEVKALGLVDSLADLDVDRKTRLRPAPMGVSGGHYKISAGTCGELLIVGGTMLCIGSNNHVAANSNDADIGDPFLQPGPADQGQYPQDVIGYLYKYEPISFIGVPSECPIAKTIVAVLNAISRLFGRKTRLIGVYDTVSNLVDAAAVMVQVDTTVESHILDIGTPNGTKPAELDMVVQKSGRTTMYTCNTRVTSIDATLNVNYGNGRVALFTDQIVVGRPGFSGPGDSGSLVLDMDNYAVGKLFAGSDTHTIINKIGNYLDALDAELVTT